MEASKALTANRGGLAAGLVCFVLALVWGPTVSMDDAWGWDESMHVGYPSARIALALRDGAVAEAARAVHDCRQYPFVYPALLGGLQVVTGVSELACRLFGRLLWCAGLFGLFLLARELTRSMLAPWLALAFGALSPMALAYSGSLFLELPFVVFSIFTLRAWLRRAPGESRWRELAAGAWLALAFFTKFNYGALLSLALFLDLLVEALGEVRAGRTRELAVRSGVLAAVPLLGIAWWFLLPLPFGAEMATSHRAACASFLGGNRDPSMAIGWDLRVLHWTCFLSATPRMLLLQMVALAATLPRLRERPVRMLWIVLLAGGLPVWTHNYHLDRFLLPAAVPLWCLAALGLAGLVPSAAKQRALALAGIALCALAFPSRDAWLILRATGLANPEYHGYQRRVLADFRKLAGARPIPTNGLSRDATEAYLDLVEPEVGPDTRVGWIGISSSFSPAALHLGLLQRGAGAPAAVRRGDLDRTFVELGFVDPGWTRAQVLDWASRFDLILATDPIDLKMAGRRGFMQRHLEALLSGGEWTDVELGSFEMRRPSGESYPVRLIACRPVP